MRRNLNLPSVSVPKLHRNLLRRLIVASFILLLAMGLLHLTGPTSSQSPPTDSKLHRARVWPSPPAVPPCQAPTLQTIYAPTIGLPEIAKGRIVFNSRVDTVTDVQTTFYSEEGMSVAGPVVRLQPAEIRYVEIASLIPLAQRWRVRWGGMSLAYSGKVFDVWAQITLRGALNSGSSDVTFSVLNGRGSDTQEAVWWMPRGGRAVVALGNASDTLIHTQLEYSSGNSQAVDIAPYGTEYVWLSPDRPDSPPASHDTAGGESVRLKTTGPAGSLKAVGLIIASHSRLVSSMRFYDMKSAVQQNLFSTNLRLRGYLPRIVLKNTSAANVIAQPRFRSAVGENGNPVELPAITLAPEEISEVNLDPLLGIAAGRTDLDSVSVQIINSGSPGSLIGAIFGVNQKSGATYDVPLRDSGINRANGGAYPWRIDGDFNTVATITNVGDTPSRFIAEIYYPGGRYLFGHQDLAVGQTVYFDLRRIRDTRLPDANGDLLPPNVTSGQFRWHWFPGPNAPHMIGRAAMTSASEGVSASYSCMPNCGAHGPEYTIDGYTTVFAGAHETMHTKERWYGATGGYNEYNTDLSWATVDNSSVANLGYVSNGWLNVNGLAAGDTDWWWSYWYGYEFDDGFDCRYAQEEVTGSEPAQVDTLRALIPNPSVTEVDGSAGVIAGQSFTIVLQAIEATGNIDLSNTSTVNTVTSRTLDSTEIGLPSSISLSGGQYTKTVRLNRVNSTERGTTFRFVPSGGGQLDLPAYTYFAVTATLEGLVGGTTACGHVITSNDHFVALPSTGLCNTAVVVRNAGSPLLMDSTTIRDVGPWFPNTPGPGNSNTCNGGNDAYWNTGGVPRVLSNSCDSNNAAIDLANGTASTISISGLGSVLWRFN